MRAPLALLTLFALGTGCGLVLDLDPVHEPDDCNGVDDDDDGMIDEDPSDPELGTACFDGPADLRGIGACVEGTVVCEGGALICSGAGLPSEEICNGIDDDCDGSVLPEEGTVGCNREVFTPGATRVIVEVAPPTIDLHFNLDTTGSMGAVIDALRTELMTFIVPGVRALFPDAAFGVSSFDDFPVSPFGFPPMDFPYELHQRVTTDVAATQRSLVPLFASGGSDAPESGIESLFQIATGRGRSWTDPLLGTTAMIPVVDCASGFDASAGHGGLGGACFREGALPVIVHLTDVRSHEGTDYPFDAAGSRETMLALNDIGARVVSLWSSFDSVADQDPGNLLFPLGMSLATDATVPLCAFDEHPARLDGTCLAGMCCTGLLGAGIPPEGDTCPLAFDVSRTALGIEDSIVFAVDSLTRYATFDLSVDLIDDDGDGVDARCFVQSVRLLLVDPPPDGDCTVPLMQIDTDGDGLVDTVENATPGTRATFHLELDNVDSRDVDGDGDRTEACAGAGSYRLEVRILPAGSAALYSRELTVTVP